MVNRFLGESYQFNRHEAFQRYTQLAAKHKAQNDIYLYNMDQEAIKKLESPSTSSNE